MAAAVVFEHLSKEYPGATRPAVRDVSLTVDQGEFLVLLGPSGCGKTTLMKMVNRLFEPTAGRILVDGTEIHQLPATVLRRRIGYVIQQIGLFPHMRVEDNIATVPRLLKWDRLRISKRVDELLELVGLPSADFRRRYPRQLSGGQAQRVGIARAMAADPALMLMDEPFGAIDAITRARLQEEMQRIQRQLHKTILFVTHDVEEALKLADRIVIMRNGAIVQYATPEEILTHPADAFVRDLVGADDVLRRLRLVTTGMLLKQMPALTREAPANLDGRAGLPVVAPDEDLRHALALLLGGGVSGLEVVEAGQRRGWITIEAIRQFLQQESQGAPSPEPRAPSHE